MSAKNIFLKLFFKWR